jgi:hypothetical protein
MYPADLVNAYVERAEATIAGLRQELAAARARAAAALAALTGSALSDAAEDGVRAEREPSPSDAVHTDPLEGFLDDLHKPV